MQPYSSKKKIIQFIIVKRSAMSTIFLQHFHNKSHMVSCYWFKFEFSIKIIFLTQQ